MEIFVTLSPAFRSLKCSGLPAERSFFLHLWKTKYSARASTPSGEEKLAFQSKWTMSIVTAFALLATALAIPAFAVVQSEAEWTVMVYLDGDNNLDPDSVSDIEEMKMVGSTDKVNVLVLWDRYNEPAYLYQVLDGELKLMDGLTVDGKSVNGQEVSMADWRVLEAFVDYGEANLPAKHYMLDLWDHGNAFGYTCWDDHAAPDWATPARAISLAEVGRALQGSAPMDILTYDGCTIGMIEIAYNLTLVTSEIGVQIDYLVASEEYIPNSGYAYNVLLGRMNSMDDLSAGSVARMLADAYAECYSPHGQAKGSSTVGLTVVEIANVEPIVQKLNALTSVLTERLKSDFDTYHKMIAEARGEGNLGWSLNGWDDRADLGAILLALSSSNDVEVAALAGEALESLVDAVYVANTPALQSQSAFGLGVWFPLSVRSLGNANTGGYGVIDQYSRVFEYAEDAGWLSFLQAFWGKAPKTG